MNTDKLIELGKLYKDGLLTREEFEEQKNLLKKEQNEKINVNIDFINLSFW